MDEITGGGLPKGRPTLVSGGAGAGKTMFALEFLVRGATECGEPGVFMSFEETAGDLAANVASLGFDLDGLCAGKKLFIDHVHAETAFDLLVPMRKGGTFSSTEQVHRTVVWPICTRTLPGACRVKPR